ncbi:cyclic peptide export ABC transporter [Paraburkholderia caballeronis]|uniref:cyclic peptide export ABC transporter n=1 Tax=Paraburkholderia caballeronis TaxID=416943 RepID=UPI0010D21F0A|nr:cyclic peptide export ABC transporter [Paraburkholderia caballeronis]TDV15830.1 putative ATP-binding cassette transporter [Paraburkholderia caballeronis]TDV18085.1 putative ATP-binding cassette transporter [Paraburkholderia caballeronis]TDV26301.1 putative ATP-binding cassette transporter [Paraburkholderia caballeronis]
MMNDSDSVAGGGSFAKAVFRLLRPYWVIVLVATAMGGVSGLCTAWLLAVINDGLHAPGGITGGMVGTFVLLCVVTLSGNAIAGIANSVTGQKIIAALRKDIASRIVCAPIPELERYRIHRLLATLNSDIDTVSAFTFGFPSYAVALAVAVGCIGYMLILSPVLFVIAAIAIVLGALVNQYASGQWARHYEGVRTAQDDLQKQYRAITEGAKELRINRERRLRVYGVQLTDAADRISDLKIKAMRLFYGAGAVGSTLFFVVIGVILLMQHQLGVDSRVVSGFVIVLLYVRGPVEQLAGVLPTLSQARISFRRIAELSAQFQTREARLLTAVLADGERRDARQPDSIELRSVVYAFPKVSDAPPFTLGPIDLKIERGETLFIIGENGSGKTTLIKILLGLYAPQGGQLMLDGEPVGPDGLDDYRQLFSAVFSDYHLFDDIVASDPALIVQAAAYLEQFEIAHKVRIENGVFSTIDLSTGQRKRLALVHALLEQRPIMMFDEWAADQDPTFRRIFYTEFLPELKRQGKTLIVVSHDDRYFGGADKIIRIRDGKIVQQGDGASFAYAHVKAGEDLQKLGS